MSIGHDAAALVVEQRLRAAIARSAQPAQDPSNRERLEIVAKHIERALRLMRFETPFERGGPFRNEPFGRTPVMPTGPLFAGVDAARTSAAGRPDLLELAALLDALEDLQRELIFSADCAESTDALNNSRQYLQAAGYLDLAATELMTCLA